MLGPRKPLGGKYVGSGGALVTPEQVAQQKQIAAALLEQAGDTSPVGHWSAALNRGLQGWLGGRDMYRARQSESEGTSKALERFNARNSGAGAASRVAEALAGGGITEGGGTPDVLGLIREFEGFRDTPYWDVNAHRTGYGSDTVTLADGSVVPVTPGMKITREDAERDLRRRVEQEFMPRAISAVGQDVWGSLSEPQRAALTSITYNYGSLPQTVARAVASGDIGAATNAIAALGSHNDGVNAKRRQREAAIFGGAGAGISAGPSARNVSEIAELLADQWLPESAKAVLRSEYDQQLRMQNAAYEMQLQQQDPLRQIQLQQERLKLEQMLNPAPVVPEAPETQVFYDEASGQDYRAQWNPQTMTWERVGGMKAPGGPLVQVGGDGMMGAVPAGMEVFLNSEGRREMRPIVGSEQWIAEQNKGKAAEKAEDVQSLEGATIMRSAGQALQASRNRLLGGFGQNVMSELMPWSEAADTSRYVGTLKANASLGNLQAMRESSPTGAALGSITERELATLESKSGALDPSSKNFERDLEDYTRTLFETIHGTEKGRELFEREWAKISTQQGSETISRPKNKSEYDALPSGATFIAPDGTQRRKP